MTLATATQSSKPNARMVLLKDFDERVLSSTPTIKATKGRARENPQAAWSSGGLNWNAKFRARRVIKPESDGGRPFSSRLGAWRLIKVR